MKLWILVGFLVLAAILVIQNSEVVTVQFLVWEAQLSQVVLLLLTLAIGFALGFLVAKLPRGGGN